MALELLESQRMPTEGLSSKAWDVFATPDAPPMDFVITVCDNAAGEVCPVWPGQPMTAHWGIPDPAAVEGSEEAQRRAFSDACHMLLTRIRLFTSLPLAKLDRLAAQEKPRRHRPPAIVSNLGRALLAEFVGTTSASTSFANPVVTLAGIHSHVQRNRAGAHWRLCSRPVRRRHGCACHRPTARPDEARSEVTARRIAAETR